MIFEDLGEQLVKNIAHSVRAFRLRISGDASEEEALTPAGTAEPPEGVSAPEASSEPSADSEVALELAFWNSVKDGGPTELETYLERCPDGTSPRSPERGLMLLHCLRPARRRRPSRSLRTLSILLSGSQSRIVRDAKSSRLI